MFHQWCVRCAVRKIQSQPCHWRNIKSVTKRDVSNVNKTIANEVAENGKKEKSVSDNISLFQSLRVLQEGEGDEFSSAVQSKYLILYLFFFLSFSNVKYLIYLFDLNRCICRSFCHLFWNKSENAFTYHIKVIG